MAGALSVGILGGMGPAATIDLMTQVLLASPRGREQDGIRLLVDSNPAVPDRNDAILRGGPSPGPVLAAMAQGLERGGAALVAMACNTAHAFQFDIERAIGVPFVSMIEETTAVAAELAATRGPIVGVLAADGCLAANLYQEALARRGLTCLPPEPAQQAEFMTLLYEIKTGDLGEDVSRRVARIAMSLEDAGADVLIAACTEAPLVLRVGMTRVPLVSSTQALASAIVDYAFGRRRPPPPFSWTTVGEA